jgi:hypothetical protein
LLSGGLFVARFAKYGDIFLNHTRTKMFFQFSLKHTATFINHLDESGKSSISSSVKKPFFLLYSTLLSEQGRDKRTVAHCDSKQALYISIGGKK